MMDGKSVVMSKLRENGYRITSQRELLVRIILENEFSSCKEIYYKALKEDQTVGIATVYRIVKTLEDLELINRKNLYNICYDKIQFPQVNQIVLVNSEEDKIKEVPKGKWFEELEKELKQNGYLDNQEISIVIKLNGNQKKEGAGYDQLYYSCECDNVRCGYHR